MSLNKEIKGSSIVILAQSFNTSIFNHLWLVNRGIVTEEKILPNSLIVPGVSHIFTPDFSLQVTQEQLQFNCTNDNISNFKSNIDSSLVKIVSLLPEMPYRALGINFNCFISDPEKTIPELSKELFFIPKLNINSFFETKDARFGTYLSCDFLDSRLKLDIKPVHLNITNSQVSKELIQLTFNFHIELNNNYKMLMDNLGKWDLYFEKMNEILFKL